MPSGAVFQQPVRLHVSRLFEGAISKVPFALSTSRVARPSATPLIPPMLCRGIFWHVDSALLAVGPSLEPDRV